MGEIRNDRQTGHHRPCLARDPGAGEAETRAPPDCRVSRSFLPGKQGRWIVGTRVNRGPGRGRPPQRHEPPVTPTHVTNARLFCDLLLTSFQRVCFGGRRRRPYPFPNTDSAPSFLRAGPGRVCLSASAHLLAPSGAGTNSDRGGGGGARLATGMRGAVSRSGPYGPSPGALHAPQTLREMLLPCSAVRTGGGRCRPEMLVVTAKPAPPPAISACAERWMPESAGGIAGSCRKPPCLLSSSLFLF